MKKLFISQPMRGKTDEEILAVREKAIKSAEEMIGEPVEVIDSFFQSAPADARPLWFLGKITGITVYSRCGIFCRRLE